MMPADVSAYALNHRENSVVTSKSFFRRKHGEDFGATCSIPLPEDDLMTTSARFGDLQHLADYSFLPGEHNGNILKSLASSSKGNFPPGVYAAVYLYEEHTSLRTLKHVSDSLRKLVNFVIFKLGKARTCRNHNLV